ncbi:MAG: hypothetical protein GY760_26710 [Deltaproteobacteria bacterium]|nr:hypothetical protein [Deltaproteobacteria bacterium]
MQKTRRDSSAVRAAFRKKLMNDYGMSQDMARQFTKPWDNDVKGWNGIVNDTIKVDLLLGAVTVFGSTYAAREAYRSGMIIHSYPTSKMTSFFIYFYIGLDDWMRGGFGGSLNEKLISFGFADSAKPIGIRRKLDEMAKKPSKSSGGGGGGNRKPRGGGGNGEKGKNWKERCDNYNTCKNKNCKKWHAYKIAKRLGLVKGGKKGK